MSPGNIDKFDFMKISRLRNVRKRHEALDIIVKKVQAQFLTGERYRLHIHCKGTDNLQYLFANLSL